MKLNKEKKKKSRLPLKRRLIQLYAALLFNANLKGFGNGFIYRGAVKNMCAPGLNCYSCPGASAACPLGALQNSLTVANKTVPYYMFGIIMLYGLLFGRWICGFLCPFGLIQDLLHKIKTPKIKKSRVTRVLSYLKYVILALFVVAIPLIYSITNNKVPAFCKYICPAGTLEGGVGLLSNAENRPLLSLLGPLFTWKFFLLVVFIVGSVFIYRFFCRFFCPLGALYGLFNKIALIGIKLDKPKCIDCGLCVSKCKMDIRHVGDHECINCGECIEVCPTSAIQWKGSKIILPPNEIPENATEEEKEKIEIRRKKRVKAVKITAVSLASAVLVGSLVYYNFIDKAPEPSSPPPATDDAGPTVGYNVGNICAGEDIRIISSEGEYIGTFNVSQNKGKVTVINFWYTTCQPCLEELPHFEEVYKEYTEKGVAIDMIAICSADDSDLDIYECIYTYGMSDYTMKFGHNNPGESYYFALGGKGQYPMTVVVDANGIIVARSEAKMEKAELVASIEKALAN
ncbi:MAG: 4Fe-4S binding protein [Ruminococcaceae bacterium]|nr:4Fe-4S binding protein [Oscillospiraceae bacterium]